MYSARTHFEDRAASLLDHATVDAVARDGAVTVRLRPLKPTAVGVVLYVYADAVGTVALDDPACVPAELDNHPDTDSAAIDYFIDVAVEGRATAFHLGRGGCVEIQEGDETFRSWRNALPWPGWRRRAERVEYEPFA